MLGLGSNFDEATYLEANPDVRSAVEQNKVRSGWMHFFNHGYIEGRRGAPSVDRNSPLGRFLLTRDLPQVPPPALRKRVHGSSEAWSFAEIGRICAFDIAAALDAEKVQLKDGSRVLDFGAGCGRVAMWLNQLFPNVSITGTDIDPEAIAWAQGNLAAVGKFDVNPTSPPMRYADGQFDFIYSISVFTHLPEAMQFDWLKELRRITKPGGILFLTTHGSHLMLEHPNFGNLAKAEFITKGFHYQVGNGTDGLPDFYQDAYHSDRYIKERWSEFFKIRRIIKRGMNGHQDIVVCERTN